MTRPKKGATTMRRYFTKAGTGADKMSDGLWHPFDTQHRYIGNVGYKTISEARKESAENEKFVTMLVGRAR